MTGKNPFDYIRDVEEDIGRIEVGSPRNDKIYAGDILTAEEKDQPIGQILKVGEDHVLVKLHGMDNVMEMEKSRLTGRVYHCEDCKSKKVHHDKTDKWVCPFCEL